MTQRRPPGRFDSRDYARAYSSHSLGQHSGPGSARLDPSQKGDLPSSGERVIFIWSKVADARKNPITAPASWRPTSNRAQRLQ